MTSRHDVLALVDEDLVTSTGAAVCPGIDAVVKKLRVGEISTAIIRKTTGSKTGVESSRRPRSTRQPRHRTSRSVGGSHGQHDNWDFKTTDLKIASSS